MKDKERIEIMNLFSRWRKSDVEVRTHTHGIKGTHKSSLIGGKEGYLIILLVLKM